MFGGLSLPGDWYGAVEWVFPEHMRAHELDKGEAVNPMKGAIVTCDRILTVSQVPVPAASGPRFPHLHHLCWACPLQYLVPAAERDLVLEMLIFWS